MSRRRRSRSRTRRRAPSVARIQILAGVGCALLAGLGLRAAQLGTLDADHLARRAEAQSRRTLKLPPLRGSLLDRHGRPLAVSAPTESVAASPRRLADRDAAARALARALRSDERRIRAKLAPRRSFAWVERWVSPEAAERVRALDLPGVQIHRERRRFYPNRTLAAAVVGFAGRDDRGLAGLELMHDARLRGRASELRAQRDARGRTLPPVGAAGAERRGEDVVTSLDLGLQHAAFKALRAAVERTGAAHGILVALDPHTGEVLALAQAPTFDPNRFWAEDPSRFRLRAIVDAFEPGSTLKPFTVALALEAGVVQPETVFDCERGRYRVLNRVIRDVKAHEELDVRGVLRVSSNIGAIKIAERLGSKQLVEGLRRFGLGDRTGSGFPGEAPGVVYDLREKQAVERANLAFGQGLTTTALQLAAAGAVLANGGTRITPRFERAAPGNTGAGERVISEATARSVVDMMVGVVRAGTGRAAALPHHAVAGKTGTAQKVVEGRYSDEHYIASFLGIVPAADPRLVVVVVLDEPHGVHAGGAVAAPVFREVASWAVEKLALPVDPPYSGGAE